MNRKFVRFLVVFFAVMGTLAIIGSVNSTPIEKSEAVEIQTIYLEYEVKDVPRLGTWIRCYFEDDDHQTTFYDFEDWQTTDDLIERLNRVDRSLSTNLLLHPKSHTIIEMTVNGKEILTLNESNQGFLTRRKVMRYLGYCCFFVSVVGLIWLNNTPEKVQIEQSE